MPEDNSAISNVDNAANNDAAQQQAADLSYYASLAFDGVVPTENNGEQQSQNINAQGGNNIVDGQENVETVDALAFIKEKFGVDSIEDAQKVFQEYNEFKKNPPKSEPTFSNEEAKRWYEYFTQDKEEELYKSLSARQKIKNIDTFDDNQRLKQYIRMTNPLFDDELVEDEFNTLYTVDEKKFEDEIGEVNKIALKKEQLRTKQRIMNDVEKANEYFNQYKSKIELPSIQQQPTIDNDYEAYKASTAESVIHYQKEVEPAIKNLKETEVGMQFKVADAQNQMDFNVSIDVTPEDLTQAKQAALDLQKFLDDSCYKDNKFMPAPYVSLFLKAQNLDKYAQSIARQAVMAERKRVTLKNSMGGGNGYNAGMRDYDLGKHDELKQLEQMAFPGQN